MSDGAGFTDVLNYSSPSATLAFFKLSRFCDLGDREIVPRALCLGARPLAVSRASALLFPVRRRVIGGQGVPPLY